MSKKQLKKDKKKFLKLKQKEVTIKNRKECKDLQTEILNLNIDYINLPEVEDRLDSSRPKGYVLNILKDMLEDLNASNTDDEHIQTVAKHLITFAERPITINNDYQSKSEIDLNITERVLLKNRMQGVIMEYITKDSKSTNIDYSGIRVYFELTYRLLLIGLEDKKIVNIDLYLGYSDSISDIKVLYSNDNSKYNIGNDTYIKVKWNSLDQLYNHYTIYKNKYKHFNEHSLQSLATASAMLKEYESRTNGKELLSYTGIVLNYVGVLELELKKLISEKFSLNKNKLNLVDAINYLLKLDNPALSNQKLVDKLHKVRLLRNKVAHGDSVTKEECKYIETTLLSDKILEYINIEIVNNNYTLKDEFEINEDASPETLCNVGVAFLMGCGLEKDFKKAFKCFVLASNQGYAEAQYNLGIMYEKGYGIKQDYTTAIKWYLKAANQGHIYSQFNLGVMYQKGIGTEVNLKNAIKWYAKAAHLGDIKSKINLANIYEFGIGTSPDYDKAIKLYTEAANQGNKDAQYCLGSMYYVEKYGKQDFKKSIKWFTKAANQDDIVSIYNLGSIYAAGKVVKKNPSEAIAWFMKGAVLGDINSQFALGSTYNRGDLGLQDYDESMKWYLKAASQGCVSSQFNIGRMYERGEGVKQDYDEALKWFTKAATSRDVNLVNYLEEFKKSMKTAR